jgi:hypothetical protein
LEATHELLDELDAAGRLGDPAAPPTDWVLPAGCRSVDDVASRIVSSLSWDDARAMDRSVQQRFMRDGETLSKICLKAPDAPQQIVQVLGAAAIRLLAPRVDQPGPLGAFFETYADTETARAALQSAFEAASPLLAGDTPADLTVIEIPAGADGSQLASIVQEQFETPPHFLPGGLDAIAVVREATAVPLASLPHLSADAMQALDLVRRADGVAPHARFDIETWVSPALAMR